MSMGTLELAIVAGAIVIGVLSVIGMPVILAFRHAAREREYEHAERMKALELGRVLPKDAPLWSPLKIAVGMGVFVPCAMFAVAFLATLTGINTSGVWPVAGTVGVTSIACGTYLTMRLLSLKNSTDETQANDKPHFDPDAYDVVSRRG